MRTAPEIVGDLLRNRGISLEQQAAFLQPDFTRDLHDGLRMKGMAEAVARIILAMKQSEHIAVFGDYDADGVPATALLVRVFRSLGVSVQPFIPTRAAGYGLTPDAVADLKTKGIDLLITVDNGTVSKPEIAELAASGIDVIVCDHHEPQEGHVADAALAILNPKQSDCTYPFSELCGCAIAWKLAWELYKKLGKDTGQLKWELDLVALSTVADMVPLVGENRALAWFGLKVMARSRNLGLKALAGVAGIDLASATAGHIGYRLAPRINAPSRMHQELIESDHAALRLLTTEDTAEATRLATYLDGCNQERQTLLDRHVREAEELVQAYVDDRCLVVYQPEWSTGVIGLLAGRLLEKYGRPVVVLADEGDVVKGSVRSVDGVHAVEMIAAGSEHLERYGGHGKAAGLTMKGKDVEGFRNLLNEWLRNGAWEIEAMAKAAQRPADMAISLKEADLELAEQLDTLQPFGIGFPAPLFSTRCRLVSLKPVGREKQHLACFLEQDGTQRKAIAFSMAAHMPEEGAEKEVRFVLEAEEWDRRRYASCQIRSIL
jgi:single-stranded-DNA-specific exonuclease